MRGTKTYKRAKAIESLKPGATWTAKGVDGGDITWVSVSGTPPTLSEIDAEVARLEYKDKRLKEYPSVVDQLDKIYHSGIDAWKADIKAIKDKYPKP